MLRLSHSPAPPFERVYRDHFDFVWRSLRALGVTDSSVDDAAQDTFVVVHRRLPEFEGRSSIKTWLYEIVRRVAIRYRRRAATDAVRTFELPDLRASDDLEAAVDQAMAAEVLRAFLAELDEDRRRAFVLAEFWDMPGREIADALAVNMNTVYTRLRSTRTELDRLAHRLHAKNSGALTRAMRSSRPTARQRNQAWARIVAIVGIPSATATTAASTGLAAFAKWGAAVVVAGGLGFATVSAVEPSKPTTAAAPAHDAESRPPAVNERDRAPALASTIPSPEPPKPAVMDVEPVEPRTGHKAQPQPQPRRPTQGALPEELQQLRAIRASVGRRAWSEARDAIRAYRTRFAGGALALEVDALEVELACRAADPDAQSRFATFLDRGADTNLVARLKKACAPKKGQQNVAVPRTPQP